MLTELIFLPSIDKYARPMYGATKLKSEKSDFNDKSVHRDGISWAIQSQLIESQYCCSSRVSIPSGLPQLRNIC